MAIDRRYDSRKEIFLFEFVPSGTLRLVDDLESIEDANSYCIAESLSKAAGKSDCYTRLGRDVVDTLQNVCRQQGYYSSRLALAAEAVRPSLGFGRDLTASDVHSVGWPQPRPTVPAPVSLLAAEVARALFETHPNVVAIVDRLKDEESLPLYAVYEKAWVRGYRGNREEPGSPASAWPEAVAMRESVEQAERVCLRVRVAREVGGWWKK